MASLAELLSRHPAHLWVGARGRIAGPRLATGYAPLDAVLDGGWPRGTLIELLADSAALGRLSLILPALAALTREGRNLAWLHAGVAPYAPALLQAGVDLSRVLVLDATAQRERLWAAEHCLQSGGALVMEESQRIADPLLRRLKLAAAGSGALLFLLRPSSAAATPSPAALRIQLSARPYARTRQITLIKCAGITRMLDLDLHAAGH
jgi:protein ImuA